MSPETILITGASSGIGRELAKCFAAPGVRLALVARSGAPLNSLAEELRKSCKLDVRVFLADLARPDGPAGVVRQLNTAGFKVDVLVNNAGFGAQGLFAQIPLERQLQMLQLNVTTLTQLTGLLLPDMIKRGHGGILNVASTAAFQAGPRMAVYYASKAYVLSFTEALAEEVVGTGVTVTALCPGPTATNFSTAAGMRTSRLFNKAAMSAQVVAQIGYQAFRRGHVIATPGFSNKLLGFSVRLVPRAIARKIAGALNAAK